MKNYLAILRKLDFVDLFKYGHYFINNAVEFDGNIASHSDDNKLFDMLTSRMNMFEYSFEYLIIHFLADDHVEQPISLTIENVCNIYAFDEEAKKEMSISFDPRIQLHVSPWADKFLKLQQKHSIIQSTRGVKNIWTIFGLPESDLSKCEVIITPDVVQEAFRELYAHERPVGEQSIWTYLLRYERHSYYPKGMIGFFCDFIHVFCNYSKKQELSGEIAETTELYSQFMACKKPQFIQLLKIVESSKLYQMSEQASGCRFAIAAPLFLYLKSEFADGMVHKPSAKLIKYAKEIGGFECSIAIYLLGISLGYDKTYDVFYESAKLSFFKKSDIREVSNTIYEDWESVDSQFNEPSENPRLESSNNTENGNKSQEGCKTIVTTSTDGINPNDPYIQKEPFPVDNTKEVLPEPVLWMKRKEKRKKADIRPVFDQSERSKLEEMGYNPVTRFDTTVKEIIKSYGYDPKEEKERLMKNKKI